MRSVFAILLAGIVLCPAVTWAQGTAVRACDLAAASPTDPTRSANIPGIRTEKINPKVALPACKAALAAEPENPRLLFQIGRVFEAEKDDAQARIYYEKSAAYAHAGAQNSLAMFYLNGAGGLPKDDTKAAQLLKLASDQGLAIAQFNLGALYASGRGGLQQSNEQAVQLFKLAADQGEAHAEASLGVAYINGVGGLRKNDEQAARLLKLAAIQGSSVGQFNLGFFYEAGRGGLAKSDEEAATLYKLAADQGLSLGQYRLALFYEAGRGGLSKNDKEAARLYRLAADQGNSAALSRLRVLNANGLDGLPKNEQEATRPSKLPDQVPTPTGPLLQSEVEALVLRIRACWRLPPGVDANTKISVTLRILLNPNGSLKQKPIVVEGPASPLGPAVAETAMRAVQQCQPFTMLKPEHYDGWKDLQITFDTRMLATGNR